jgi:hypothetical protein
MIKTIDGPVISPSFRPSQAPTGYRLVSDPPGTPSAEASIARVGTFVMIGPIRPAVQMAADPRHEDRATYGRAGDVSLRHDILLR